MVKTICALLLGVALTASAAPPPRIPSDYTRVLLPFLYTRSADYGGWQVQWWVRNNSDTPADVFPLTFGCGLCPPDYGTPYLPNPSSKPHTTISAAYGDAFPSFQIPAGTPVESDEPGAFLYVDSAHLPQITVTGWVQWSRYPIYGNAAPITAIAETSMLTGVASIDAVPRVDGTRYALRIYSLPETIDDSRVTVNAYEMQEIGFSASEVLIRSVDARLVIANATLPTCAPPCDLPNVAYVPAVAEAFNIVPPAEQQPSTVRVEIVPSSPNVKWWAVLSATDAQQNVTLYTPPFRMTSR